PATKNGGGGLARPPRLPKLQSLLVGRTTETGRRALGFVFGLNDHAVKRGCANEASSNNADPAQRISRIGSAMPGAAPVLAFEHHSGRRAGREQTLAALVVGDRADVLVGDTVHHVLPG